MAKKSVSLKAKKTAAKTAKKAADKRTVKKTVSKSVAAKKARSKKPAVAKPVKKTPKKTVKKAAKKKVVKKAPAKKSAAKDRTVKKVSAKKKVVKKASAKKSVAKKSPMKKTVKKAAVRKSVKKPVVAKKPAKKLKTPFKAKELREFKKLLLNLRDRIVDEISFLAGDNLNRSQRDATGDLSSYSIHMADHGTDNFNREFALNLVSSEQDVIHEIDEALRRIEDKTYGICELTGVPIEKERLKVLPYARYCVKAKEEIEKGRKRYRPFDPPLRLR